MFKKIIKLIAFIVVIKLIIILSNNINKVSCKEFNSMGSAKNINEFTDTEFTKNQYEKFIPIIANYVGEIEKGSLGVGNKEALLLMMNSEQLIPIVGNILSVSRKYCLLDDSKDLEQIIIYNFREVFLDRFKNKLEEVKSEYKKLNKKMPISIDDATDLISIEVKNNAIIEYVFKLKRVSSTESNENGISSFVSGMKNQVTEDVCSGKSIQEDVMGFTVIYRYEFNDGILIHSFNLRNIKLESCK